MTDLLYVELPWATFGLIVEAGRIARAAPIAKFTEGWPVEKAEGYYIGRGATIYRI